MNNDSVGNSENSSAHLFSLSDQSSSENVQVSNDELLLRRTFAADARQGFAFLFRRYHTNLCNHAIRFVYSKAVAEDIVAEVFMELWVSRHFERIDTSFRAYLYRAVRNRSFNYLKKELNRQVSIENNFRLPEMMTPAPDQIMQYNELQQKVEKIVQHLPPRCQRAFLLHRLEGRKYEDIGLEMAITTSAVERLISRALDKLRKELKQDGFISLLLLLLFY